MLYFLLFPISKGQPNNRYTIAYNYICNEMNNDSIYVPMMLLDNSYYVSSIEDFIDFFEINDTSIIQLANIPENKVCSSAHEYHCFFEKFVQEKIDYNFNSALFFTNISNNILIAEYFPTIIHYANKKKYYEESTLTSFFFNYYAFLFHFSYDGHLINVYKMLIHTH